MQTKIRYGFKRIKRVTAWWLAFMIFATALSSLASAMPPVVQDEQNQQKWREELQSLVSGLRRNHPNSFHGISEEEFEAAVASLDARIPTLTDGLIHREFIGLIASISRNGRDGHTQYVPPLAGLHLLPIQVYNFSDGMFITDARQPYEGLIGKRVTGVGEHPIAEVVAMMAPYIAKDNDWTVRWHMPALFIIPEFMESFGLMVNPEQVALRLQNQSGEEETVTISPITVSEYTAWREFPAIKLPQTHDELYLRDSYDPFWFSFLADSGTLYIRYNQVTDKNDSGQKLQKFVKKVKKEIKKKPVQQLVLDLRQNNGGDSNTYGPLLSALKDNATINQRGKLFAIINQGVYSAATNFVADLKKQTNVLFVGEPTGGSPNHYGDAIPVVLPNFGGTLFVSTFYHQKSDPNDERLSIEPDIAVEFSGADYFAGRDAAMAAILDFSNQQLASQLQSQIDAWASLPNHQGVSAAVILPDGSEWVGVAGRDGAGQPLASNQLISIASITKTMTAAVILQLADEKALSLDDPISRWLKPQANIRGDITIRQLLNHTNGLDNYTATDALRQAVEANPERIFTADELLSFLRPARFDPGTKTEYTNTSFVLLGQVAERVTGRSMVSLYHQRLWDPLGLSEIFLPGHEAAAGPVASVNMNSTAVAPLSQMARLSAGNSAYGLFANARTVARWGRALYGGSVISPRMQQEMRTMVSAAGNIPGETGSGLGLRGYGYLGGRQIGHSGGSQFGNSLLLYDLATGITVAVAMNQGAGADHFELAPQLLQVASRR